MNTWILDTAIARLLSTNAVVLAEQPNAQMVASLDRKRLGAEVWGGAESRSEAFSIRRLEGSRWRLRRTR
jgi:hypothetical protein